MKPIRNTVMFALLTAALIILAGCSGASTSDCLCDDDPDSNEEADALEIRDSDSDEDGIEGPSCPEPIAPSCSEEPVELPIALEAAELGAGARFVELSQGVILAERIDSGRQVIILHPVPGEYYERIGSARLMLESGVSMRPIGAVFDSADLDLWHAVALLCEDTGCALYEATFGLDEVAILAPMPGGEVPEMSEARGFWFGGRENLACAYGDGIVCFDGSVWSAPVPPRPERPAFNDLRTFGRNTVAVGDHGRIATPAFPAWSDEWNMFSPDLLTVAVQGDDDFFLPIAEGGLLYDRFEPSRSCRIADEDIVSLEAGSFGPNAQIIGITATGRIFEGLGPLEAMRGLCFTGQVVGPVLGARLGSCGSYYDNYHVITEDAFYGTTACTIE